MNRLTKGNPAPIGDLVGGMQKILEQRAMRYRASGEALLPLKPKCEKCLDRQIVTIEPGVPGTSAKVKFCECRDKVRKEAQIKKYVPFMWRGLRVNDLEPWPDADLETFPIKVQKKLISSLKAQPFAGHFFRPGVHADLW